MTPETVVVVKSKKHSKPGDARYVICAKKDGTILDDAQGYGYKSKKGALASWRYQNGDY